MAQPTEYIGTGEELAPVLKRLPKQQFHLIQIQADTADNGSIISKPFYETATAEEWVRELRAWAASHDTSIPSLSDDAMSRDSIYEGRG